MNTQHYFKVTRDALLAACLAVVLTATTFFLVEPKVGQAVDSGPFTIKQTILDEISFLVEGNDVIMS